MEEIVITMEGMMIAVNILNDYGMPVTIGSALLVPLEIQRYYHSHFMDEETQDKSFVHSPKVNNWPCPAG